MMLYKYTSHSNTIEAVTIVLGNSPEDTTCLSHRTRRNETGTDVEISSLSASCHSAGRYYTGGDQSQPAVNL